MAQEGIKTISNATGVEPVTTFGVHISSQLSLEAEYGATGFNVYSAWLQYCFGLISFYPSRLPFGMRMPTLCLFLLGVCTFLFTCTGAHRYEFVLSLRGGFELEAMLKL